MAQPTARNSMSLATLRAISYRLSSTPTKELPLIAGQIAGSLWSCKDILSSSTESLGSKNETSTAVHRFKTSLGSLLQDRTVQGRWSAVVILKATIEAGGVEILSKSNPWVKHLLSILKKPDPPTTINLAATALTRMFMLTWDYSNLVREITTPALPAFISTCLSNVEKERCSLTELHTVLEAFAVLVPRHPTIFRTHETQIRRTLVRILSSTSPNNAIVNYTQECKTSAQRLFVLLHHCAPKQGGGEKWDETFKATITAAHSTCDRLFRSVVEEWQSTAGVVRDKDASIVSATEAEFGGEDALGLHGWKGVFAGRDRMISLLGILEAHVQTATSGMVSVRFGLLIDLFTRLFTLTSRTTMEAANANSQVPKHERDALSTVLPTIHTAGLELVDAVFLRFSNVSIPFAGSLLEIIHDIYLSEKSIIQIRAAIYISVWHLLDIAGPSLPKEDVAELAPVIRGCCDDLLPPDEQMKPSSATKANGKPQAASTDLSIETTKTQSTQPPTNAELENAARAFLTASFAKINAAFMPRKVRVQMERTAVLTRHKEALVACVMNPAQKDAGGFLQTSLLPLLARGCPDCPEVEALLRPRMPAIVAGKPSGGDETYEEEEEESEEEGDGDEMIAEQETEVNGKSEDPSSGLLGGSGEQAAEEAFATSTPQQMPTTDSDKRRSKRNAPDAAAGAEVPAKRLRASPVAEAVADEASIPPPDPNVQTSLPTTTVVDSLQAESGSSGETAAVIVQPETVAPGGMADGGSDDGSDFEMPPLTMESDTDPEDDGE